MGRKYFFLKLLNKHMQRENDFGGWKHFFRKFYNPPPPRIGLCVSCAVTYHYFAMFYNKKQLKDSTKWFGHLTWTETETRVICQVMELMCFDLAYRLLINV